MCNRSVDSPRFVCRRLGKVTTERSIRSLIASACLFSRPLAVRIVEVRRSGRPAQLLRQVLDAGGHNGFVDVVYSFTQWNASVFDERVEFLALTFAGCVRRFGIGAVVI
jgi:hypothetical protein